MTNNWHVVRGGAASCYRRALGREIEINNRYRHRYGISLVAKAGGMRRSQCASVVILALARGWLAVRVRRR